MNIRNNDRVKIIAGKDKGKIGKVLQVFNDKNRVSVEGLNLLIKHIKSNKEGEKGQRIEFPAPLNVSNLMLVCPNCNKTTRISYKIINKEDGKKKVRICKKCNEIIS